MRKRLKRIVATMLVLTQFSAVGFTEVFAATDPIKVIVDDKAIMFEQQPVLDAESGRVLVPMRSIFEALGYTVNYSEIAQNILCVKETATTTITCEIALDRNFMTVRSSTYAPSDTKKLDAESLTMFIKGFDKSNPIRIVNGRMLLPTRAIAEALGCQADWDAPSKTVNINTADAKIVAPSGWAEDYLAFCEKYAPEYVYYAKETIKQEQNGIINYDRTKQTDGSKPNATQPSTNDSQKLYTVYDYLWGRDFEYTYKNPSMPTSPPVVGSVPAKILLDESRQSGSYLKSPNLDPNDINNWVHNFTTVYSDGDYGGCNWYAEGRFWEVYGIPLPHFQESENKKFFTSDTYLDAADQYDELIAIRDVGDIKAFSVAVYGRGTDGVGHVAFIEHVERDSSGNPINVYYTEANTQNDGKYHHGTDGAVEVQSYKNFLKGGGKPIIGYIIPNPDFYK